MMFFVLHVASRPVSSFVDFCFLLLSFSGKMANCEFDEKNACSLGVANRHRLAILLLGWLKSK